MTSEPENDPAEETRDPAALSRRTVSFCDLQWSAIRRHAATRDQTRAEWIREACNYWMQTQQQADHRNAAAGRVHMVAGGPVYPDPKGPMTA